MTTTKATTAERQRRQRAERQTEYAGLIWAHGNALPTSKNPRLRTLMRQLHKTAADVARDCGLRWKYELEMLRETADRMARLAAFRAAHPELFA